MKKAVLYIFLAITCFFNVTHSQNKTADSLLTIVKANSADTNAIISLNKTLINLYFDGKIDTCLSYALLTIETSTANNIYIARTYNIIANCYFYQGAYPLVIKYYLIALKIYEKNNFQAGIANVYNNLGNVYKKQNYLKEALEYHQKALTIRKKINDLPNIAFSYNNLANVYQARKEFDKALASYSEAVNINRGLKDTAILINSLNNIGGLYADMHNYVEAEKYLYEAISLNEKAFNNNQDFTISYVNLCKSYFIKNELKIAEDFGLKSLSLSEKAGDVESMQGAYNLLFDIYKKMGKFKESLFYCEKYLWIKDSLFNDENTKKLIAEQFQYEYDKKNEAQLIEQARKDAAAEVEKRKQNQITTLLIVVLIFVFSFAIFVYKSYAEKRKANDKITRQNLLIKEKQKEVIDSINYAKRIQTAVLPNQDTFVKSFDDAFVFFKPRDIVSGDLYWYAKLSTTSDKPIRLKVVAVADCTGHGVPGAFMSLLTAELLNQTMKNPDINTPAELLQFMNHQITKRLNENNKEKINDGLDIAVCAIDYENHRVFYSGANRPLWLIRNNIFEEIKATKASIGASTQSDFKFENNVIELNKGDRIYMFTDGITDQFGGEKDKKFGRQQLKTFLVETSSNTLAEQGTLFGEAIAKWQGGQEQTDDMLLVGLKI